ncbi:MAG: tRNA lysidine(34) synthetase, partial [Caulobacteraceae bacterium]
MLKQDRAPIAAAFSGGGDSLALLVIAADWAAAHGRRLVALTVDHRLQSGSDRWAAWCKERARRLGIEHRTLVWEGWSGRGNLAGQARAARHALLAQAAREAGANVILMAHTFDDLLETRWMRSAGARLGAPSEWAPSPAWPQGRFVFVLRPLLGIRRARL